MTVEVDSERVDSEKVGEEAAPTFDEAYTFNEMDVADENTVNEYDSPPRPRRPGLPHLLVSCCWAFALA